MEDDEKLPLIRSKRFYSENNNRVVSRKHSSTSNTSHQQLQKHTQIGHLNSNGSMLLLDEDGDGALLNHQQQKQDHFRNSHVMSDLYNSSSDSTTTNHSRHSKRRTSTTNDNNNKDRRTTTSATSTKRLPFRNEGYEQGNDDDDDDYDNEDDNLLSHCHLKEDEEVENYRARRTLIMASCLCLTFMLAEIVGGYIAGSLAIMTDAAHLLTDFAGFLISLFSLFMASRPATRKMSFGWHRAEVLGAFMSVLFIWIVTGVLVYMAVERIINKNFELNAEAMLITAAVGVFVNIIMGCLLHQGGHHGHSHGGDEKRSLLPTPSSPSSYNQLHNERTDSSDSLMIDDTVSVENGTTTTTTNTTSLKQHTKHHHSGGGGGQKNGHKHNNKQKKAPHHHQQHHHFHENQGCEEEQGDIEGNNDDAGSTTAIVIDKKNKVPARPAKKQNINVRAAFIHVLGDFFQSVGVLIASYVIYFHPELSIMDPICTFIFSVLVLLTTLAIMRDALNVLMEGLPRGVNFLEVADALASIEGVVRVHNLRIWSLTMDKIALSVHLAVSNNSNSQDILKSAMNIVRRQFGFYECTVQIEHYSDDMDECAKCEYPKS